jgi:ribosome biogenesis protein BRX1
VAYGKCFISFSLRVQVIKELLQQVFVTPRAHPKSKPFFDHVLSFSYCDGRVWLRNYQVVTPAERKELKSEGSTLVEVGPRVTLQPIKVLSSPSSRASRQRFSSLKCI